MWCLSVVSVEALFISLQKTALESLLNGECKTFLDNQKKLFGGVGVGRGRHSMFTYVVKDTRLCVFLQDKITEGNPKFTPRLNYLI